MANGNSLARINAAEKRQAVVNARADGKTWKECADIAGYLNAESAVRAFDQAMKEKPHRNAEQWRNEHIEMLQQEYAHLGALRDNPPVKTTAMGKSQWDPRTCTCRLGICETCDHKTLHSPDCEVKPVVDERVVISSISERRHLGESLRRMLGVDVAGEGAPRVIEDTELLAAMEWANGLGPKIREYEYRIAELEGELAQARRELERWESGQQVWAELSTP